MLQMLTGRSFRPFLACFAVLWCFCSLLREKNTKVLILGLKSILCQSDWCTECNASLAEEKKKRKKERIMNNPGFHALPCSPSYARLLTLLFVPSSSARSPKCVYTLRIPHKASLSKFWRVYCFGLSTRVTCPFPIFLLIPTYEVLAYFMIQPKPSKPTASHSSYYIVY